jgi:hypothetical protein
MSRNHTFQSLIIVVVATLLGCEKSSAPTPAASSSGGEVSTAKAAPKDHSHEGHAHGEGPHGGTVADWGGGKYHVEFTVDHDKQEATVYLLGNDEKTPSPIKATDGNLLLTIKEPAFQVELVAQPLEGEADGVASRFVGKNEKLGVVQEFAGTISGEVEGTPYAGDFAESAHTHE